MTVDAFLREATDRLTHAGINTARLDGLVLLGDELSRDKAWIFAHGDTELTAEQLAHLRTKLARRIKREPLAYIRETQEFFGRSFVVTPDVLIPRPETETLVELLINLPLAPDATVIDVGTGSGAIAISAKLARPNWHVYATDISPAALEVARRNATRLQANVLLSQTDLLTAPPVQNSDCVIANLPYVDKSWQRSPEVSFEPALALFADNGGLALITELIQQAHAILQPGGFLLLEADERQLPAIVTLAETAGFAKKYAQNYSLIFAR